MNSYRITEVDSRIVVGTEEEPLLVCASRKVADQAVADATLLTRLPATWIFSRRVIPATEN